MHQHYLVAKDTPKKLLLNLIADNPIDKSYPITHCTVGRLFNKFKNTVDAPRSGCQRSSEFEDVILTKEVARPRKSNMTNILDIVHFSNNNSACIQNAQLPSI